MSGITGFTSQTREKNDILEMVVNMKNSLSHRGPNESGVYVGEKVALGLVGEQPIHHKFGDNEYIIACDGSLYNADEMRDQLRDLGQKFYTDSDMEVLLVSFLQWGENALEHLNGVFAFSIYNSAKNSLFIARDHIGVRPLFFTVKDNELIFGSEIKAILAHPDISPIVDNNGLAEIFALAPTRTPGFGIFKNIHELKPGHFLIWNNGNLSVRKYWDFISHEHEDNLSATAEKLRHYLKNAVTHQMKANTPIATFLSGGLDSSSITAICANEYAKSGDKLSTYSFDYKENDKFFKSSLFQPDSDNKWVNRMSSTLKTNHTKLIADTDDLLKELYNAVKARDLPSMADIDSSFLFFCKETKRRHNIVLSGEGADEILGGYLWFHSPKSLETDTFPWVQNISERINLLNRETADFIDGEHYISQRYIEAIEKTPRLFGESPHEARRREIFYLNISWFGANLLERTDRMSMASGLEVRVPFVDRKLAQYVWNIPWNMKALGGREKGIMRLALKGILPDDILERKKSPYPKTYNPTYESVVKTELIEVLNNSNNKITPLINKKVIKQLMEDKSEIGKPFFGQLMSRPQMYAFLLQVNFWLEHYNISIR